MLCTGIDISSQTLTRVIHQESVRKKNHNVSDSGAACVPLATKHQLTLSLQDICSSYLKGIETKYYLNKNSTILSMYVKFELKKPFIV